MDEDFVRIQDRAPILLDHTLTEQNECPKNQFQSHDRQLSPTVLRPIERQNLQLGTTRREASHDRILDGQQHLKDRLRSDETYLRWACNVCLECQVTHLPSELPSLSFAMLIRLCQSMTSFKMTRPFTVTAAQIPMLMASDLSRQRPRMAAEELHP